MKKIFFILFMVSWIVELGVSIFSILNVARAAACKCSLSFRNSRIILYYSTVYILFRYLVCSQRIY